MSACSQTRRQSRKSCSKSRQTRRQYGGNPEARDLETIDKYYAYVENPAKLIGKLYTEMYFKCPAYAPKSKLGGKEGDRLHILEENNFPESKTKKPLSSIIRCAYNLFEKYASRKTGDTWNDDKPLQYRKAGKLCSALEIALITLTKSNTKASKLFLNITKNL
jgi:hypothetical protein